LLIFAYVKLQGPGGPPKWQQKDGWGLMALSAQIGHIVPMATDNRYFAPIFAFEEGTNLT